MFLCLQLYLKCSYVQPIFQILHVLQLYLKYHFTIRRRQYCYLFYLFLEGMILCSTQASMSKYFKCLSKFKNYINYKTHRTTTFLPLGVISTPIGTYIQPDIYPYRKLELYITIYIYQDKIKIKRFLISRPWGMLCKECSYEKPKHKNMVYV